MKNYSQKLTTTAGKVFILFIICFFTINFVHPQGVGISETGDPPDPSAMLDVKSLDKGILVPRVTMAQRDDIYNPATGLLIFQTDNAPGFYYFNGSSWSRVGSGTGFEPGTNSGAMLYWDGYQWLELPPGEYGSFLTFCDGIPVWGGCKPLVTTFPVTGISYHSATGGGEVMNDGGKPPVSVRGIIWSTMQNPTLDQNEGMMSGGAGMGSFSIEMIDLLDNTTYFVKAFATNSAGTSYGNEVEFLTLEQLVPDPPGAITGNSYPLCGENGVLYSVAPVPDATSYNWTVPVDAVIAGGQGTNTITVDFGIESGTVAVCAVNDYGNSDFTILPVSVGLVATPETIYGPVVVCINSAQEGYKVDTIPGTAYYNWSVPPGAQILDGQGTDSINVSFGSQSGNVSVIIQNACSSSGPKDLFIDVDSHIGCFYEGGIVFYKNDEFGLVCLEGKIGANAWACTFDITSGNGAQGTAVGSGFDNTVAITTDCQDQGAARACYDLTANGYDDWFLPSIGELEQLCLNLFEPGLLDGAFCWSSSEISSMEADWLDYLVCGGSSDPGMNSKTNAFYTWPVRAFCNDVPATPQTINGNSNPSYNETGVIYSIAPIFLASSYTWAVPSDATIASGQGTNSITVDFGTQSGYIEVMASNACGNSGSCQLAVTVTLQMGCNKRGGLLLHNTESSGKNDALPVRVAGASKL